MKRKIGSVWEVDLKEARWESKASIAKSIGKGLVDYSTKDLEHAEAKLRKLGLIQTKIIAGPKNNVVGRYLAFTKKALDIFKNQGQKINKETSEGVPHQQGTPPPTAWGRGTPHDGGGYPTAWGQSNKPCKVTNNISNSPPPQQGRGVLPQQERGTPPAGEESKESFKVNNHIISKAPPPKLGAPPKDPGLIPISEW
jgi:hypothetical protein